MGKTTTKSDKALARTTGDLALPPETPENVRDIIERSADRIAQALPRHVEAQRFIRSAVLAAIRDDKLRDAAIKNPVSLASAVMQAAELGLDFSPTLGLAALVPFNNRKKDRNGEWRTEVEITLIPMYRGLAALARRGGNVEISAECVFDGDLFRYTRGTDPRIEHEPRGTHKGKENITHVYAIARFPDARAPKFVVLTIEQVEDIRLHFSQQSEGKLWGGKYCPEGQRDNNYHEACRKTAVRRLAKEIDLSPELLQAVALGDREFEDRLEIPPTPEGRQQFGFKTKATNGAKQLPAGEQVEEPTGATDEPPTEDVPSHDVGDPADGAPSPKAGKPRRVSKKPEPEPEPEPGPDANLGAMDVGDRWPYLVETVAERCGLDMDEAEERLTIWLAQHHSMSRLSVKSDAKWRVAVAAVNAEQEF